MDDGPSDGSYFHIDQDTGVIWTARDLFAVGKPTLTFVVRASDYGAPLRHTDVIVTLQVEDVNNNPPQFDQVKRNLIDIINLSFREAKRLKCFFRDKLKIHTSSTDCQTTDFWLLQLYLLFF